MSSYPADKRPVGAGVPLEKDEDKWGPIPAKWGKVLLGLVALVAGTAVVLKMTDKDDDVERAANRAGKDAKHKAKELKKDVRDAFK